MGKHFYCIDILKFLATLAIFNHLSARFYGEYAILATGGAVGCALFFFCSGYTLTCGRFGGFATWYKRRLARIWPTCIAVAFLAGIMGRNASVMFALKGTGWFVESILIYYFLYYWLRRFFPNKEFIWLVVSVIIVVFAYFQLDVDGMSDVWVFHHNFRRIYYFLFFVAGCCMSKVTRQVRYPIWLFTLALFMIVFFYSFCFLCGRHASICKYQFLSLIPLMGFVVCLYFSLSAFAEKSFWQKRCVSNIVHFIGGLSLEIYTCRVFMDYYPIIPIPMVANLLGVVIAFSIAYIVRAIGRFFVQTISLQKKEYDWDEIWKAI